MVSKIKSILEKNILCWETAVSLIILCNPGEQRRDSLGLTLERSHLWIPTWLFSNQKSFFSSQTFQYEKESREGKRQTDRQRERENGRQIEAMVTIAESQHSDGFTEMNLCDFCHCCCCFFLKINMCCWAGIRQSLPGRKCLTKVFKTKEFNKIRKNLHTS